jgi:diguanylate cyclase (GGDEF)-like protein
VIRRAPRSTPPASLSQHVRTAAWAAALVALVGTAVAVVGARPGPVPLAAALLGLAWLTAHWGLGRRSERAHWGGDLLDGLALVPVACVLLDSPQVLALAHGGVFLRALRSGPGAAVLRVPLYLAALCGGRVLADAPRVEAASVVSAVTTGTHAVPGLVFMTAFTVLLRAALARADRAARRDRLLAGSGTRLMAVRSPDEVVREAEAAAARMVADLPDVGLRLVGPPTPDPATGRHRPTGLRSGGRGTLRALPFDDGGCSGGLEIRGRACVLDEAEPALAVLARQVGLALRTCAAEADLRRRAETDGLTGLATGEVLRAALDRAAREAGAPGDPGTPAPTLLLVDCDDFKDVNDRRGHVVGDAVLREVAHRLRQGAGAGALAARLGGDEFAVLLAAAPPDVLAARVEHLARSLNRPVSLPSGAPVRLSCSVGATRVRPGRTAVQLIHDADTAMYAAKAAGKGRHASLDGPGPGAGPSRVARGRGERTARPVGGPGR